MPVKARNTDIEFQDSGLIPDPGAAGVDSTNQEVWRAPFECEITKLEYVYSAATAGVDGSNTVVTTFKRNNTGTAVATSTKTAVINPGVLTDAGTLDSTTRFFAKDDKLTVDVTTGATANAAEAHVIVRYRAKRGS